MVLGRAAEDPVVEAAVVRALLAQIGAGERRPTLRLFEPLPTVAFGRLDVRRPGFAAAVAIARRHGRTPIVRPVGGHAATYDERALVVEHLVPAPHAAIGLHARFAAFSARLRDALALLGADARVGELPGEYCPGAYSVNVGGHLKVAGVAQRATKDAAVTSAVVVVGGGAELRAIVAEVYDALGLAVDPSSAGALDEAVPGVTAGMVADAVRVVFARDHAPLARPLDRPPLLAAAAPFVARHRP